MVIDSTPIQENPVHMGNNSSTKKVPWSSNLEDFIFDESHAVDTNATEAQDNNSSMVAKARERSQCFNNVENETTRCRNEEREPRGPTAMSSRSKRNFGNG